MDGGFREWLSGLTRRELAMMAILALAALVGGGLWYVRSLPQPVSVRAAPAPAPTAATPIPGSVFVHVAGAVRRPGVYELPEGSRVIDALEAAGGAERGGDLAALNLAAVLADGQQVLVTDRGATPSSPVAGGAVPSPGAPASVNVNAATPEELETLPGIGEVLAAAIVQFREEHGPFSSVDQLLDVSGIGEVTLEEIRDFVTV
jgi:competence protein ComEA